ncbi:MFS transporter [Allopusillimonas soli]|uniref:MFS transporter n=1 Tax=Allopusillimonas soli TaxID=659016 RepID=A0A853F9V5_9BURK|nr:MFS transporter [Allopusillimonas soli]NYT36392.1 MFS transporter [Allopusillimonas soli]TEA74905.1 MFS transporter [Allopusillimonas soli]
MNKTISEAIPSQIETDDHPLQVVLLLNVGHALDHLFLLIFATAVGTIAVEFNFAHWEDLMPYSVGAFFLFGLGSVPSGRLGDLWGRRQMMLVFFFGLGAAALLTALARGPWQLAAGLALIGLFASIYHPVGIPMLVQRASRPGAAIGINGLAGNLGVAGAALLTGFLVQAWGWRMAFAVPGVIAIGCGAAFALLCGPQGAAPGRSRKPPQVVLPPKLLARALIVMTAAAVTGSMLFNFTTNGNTQFLTERFENLIEDPAMIGLLLAIIYTLASLTQVVVGKLIDKVPLKRLYLCLVLAQIPWLLLASLASGWWLFIALLGAMVCIFGCIPFTDAMIVKYVDDSIRSRVAGMRLAVSFGISSLAVWLLGPVVKASSFAWLFLIMAGIATCTALVVLLLPSDSVVARSQG